MVKSLFFVVIFYLLSCNSITGNETEKDIPLVTVENNPLAKYSYLVLAKTLDNKMNAGTCFFVNIDSKFYLISAAHMFIDWNTMTNKPSEEKTQDTLLVRLYKNDGSPFWAKMSTKEIKVNGIKDYFYKLPDIYVAQIELQTNTTIIPFNTINKYISNNLNYFNPDKIIIYGYPESSFTDSFLIKASPQFETGRLVGNYTNSVTWKPDNVKDTINYIIDSLNDNSAKGFSGAPVFWINGLDTVFGGVLFAGDNKGSFIVRPQYVFSSISRMHKN